MSDKNVLDEKKKISEQITEALSMLRNISKRFLEYERIKISKENAITGILKAKMLTEKIDPFSVETLEQKQERLRIAREATNQAVSEVEDLIQCCSMMEEIIRKGTRELADKINEIHKKKYDDGNDKWVHILHLSDLHFGYYYHSENDTSEQDKADYLNIVKVELFEFFKSYTQKNGKIDIIAITGDISYQNDSKGYNDFEDWLKGLCHEDILNLDIKEKVIMCVGNHDSSYTDRKKFGIISNEEAKKDKSLGAHSVDHVLSMDWISQRQEQFKEFNNVCENLGIKRLANFDLPSGKKPIHYLYGTREIEGINFIVLNTAWNSFPRKTKEGEDNGFNHGKLFLGSRLIRNFLPKQKDQRTTITLFHHPLSWLHETELRAYGKDQEVPVMKRIHELSDMILNGHVHGKIEAPDILANKTLVFGGGTLNTNDSKIFQFEILSVNITNHYCTQRIVTYHRELDDGGKAKGWMVEMEGNLPQFYFDAYRSARELIVKVVLGEITQEEALQSAKEEVKKAFKELDKKNKYYKIRDAVEMYFMQSQEEENQIKESKEKNKIKNKERDKE